MPKAGRPRDRKLKLEALLWLLVIRLVLATRSFLKTLTMVERFAKLGPQSREPEDVLIARVEWAVARAARWLPKTLCLPQALAGRILLARRGISSELQIGVTGPNGSALHAHAWLERAGVTVFGDRDGHEYTPLDNKRDSLS